MQWSRAVSLLPPRAVLPSTCEASLSSLETTQFLRALLSFCGAAAFFALSFYAIYSFLHSFLFPVIFFFSLSDQKRLFSDLFPSAAGATRKDSPPGARL